MSLIEALRARWAADATLEPLLAAGRVRFERTAAAETPWGVIRLAYGPRAMTANAARVVERLGVQLIVAQRTHSLVAATVAAVIAAFDCATIDFVEPPEGASARLLDLRFRGWSAERLDEGLWQATAEFEGLVERSRAAAQG